MRTPLQVFLYGHKHGERPLFKNQKQMCIQMAELGYKTNMSSISSLLTGRYVFNGAIREKFVQFIQKKFADMPETIQEVSKLIFVEPVAIQESDFISKIHLVALSEQVNPTGNMLVLLQNLEKCAGFPFTKETCLGILKSFVELSKK